MNIALAGGTGFIGQAVCDTLAQHNHNLTVLTRDPDKSRHNLGPSVNYVGWDARSAGAWEKVLDSADAVINLAGEPIADGRWTKSRKHRITESRIASTRLLTEGLLRASRRPRTLINASAIGFYGARDASPVTEKTDAGSGFLADLCVAWEREALKAESLGLRVVLLRIGMVLGPGGGALTRMVVPFKAFVGGPILPGRQWVSWIHIDDLIGLIEWSLVHEHVKGPVNAVAPAPVTMREFCNALGRVLSRPSWLPVPEFMLRLGLGELSGLMTTGQRVEPATAMRGGYTFKYPALEPALQDIFHPMPHTHDDQRIGA